MMELAAAAFATLAGGASATGSAVAAGATTAASTAAGAAGATSSIASIFGSSTWLSALQLGAAGLGVYSQMQAGTQKSDQLLSAASDAEAQIGNEQLIGMERRSSLKREAAQAIAERQAAYAAGGVDLSFGTPVQAQAQDARDAEHALAIDQGTQDQRVGRLAERAAEFRSSAGQAKKASRLQALLTGGEALLSIGRRGVMGL